MTITPSYVGEPECNGVIERVETLAEAQRTIGEFIARYNAEWLIANGSGPSERRLQATRLHDHDDAGEAGPQSRRPPDGARALVPLA